MTYWVYMRASVDRLVYVQGVGDVTDAITYEMRLKRWRRAWKVRPIEGGNPHWEDLYLHMTADPAVAPCAWVPDSRFAASAMTGLKARWAVKF